ncbi:MAG: ECF-type sigma factor [Gemmataceae bacterium]|nr:ECF-type sigma factor [Gemmataceae bacterium]
MSTDHSISNWIADVKQGDQRAAQALWERFFERLVRLAKKKLGNAPRRAADEEDVALSAFDSLCRGARKGNFPLLNDRDDLWKLLVIVTARKASDQALHERRQKRGGGKLRGESVFQRADPAQSLAGLDQMIGSDPTPQFALQVSETFERFLEALGDETLRKIARWKLENYTHKEIAANLGVSEETIRRKMQRIQLTLERLEA